MNTDDERIRVLIADDHALFCQGIAEILAAERDMKVVGEARSGPEAITVAQRERPDVVMLDVEMPGPGAEEVTREILRRVPATHVIVLTMHDEPRLVDRLIAAGAHAYVIKGVDRAELLAVIRGVMSDDGRVVISVSRETMARLREGDPSPLSPRELEVLDLVSAGFNNAQIAARLFIMEGTVKRHLTNIYMKLDVTTRMNAINKAIAMGLIAPKEFRRQTKQ